MAQFFSKEKLAEIQQASNIVNIVSRYVSLINRGKNYFGLCPFHSEKTPSFTVNADRQFYKCFGCGESGTVFTFLMKHNGVSFVDAVRELAGAAGIVLPNGGNLKNKGNEISPLYDINTHFVKYYNGILFSDNQSISVRDYIKKRGINDKTVEKFQLGYSRSSWDSSLREALAHKFKIESIENAGIVVRRKDGSSHYDRFRGRLMFPIFNDAGNAVGFGARTLKNEQPKYLNSPESTVFNKRRILYGLNFAKEAISRQNEAVIMEGYTDVIMAHQYGIDWTVGVMGTSLTEDHIKLITRYCSQVVLVLDSDVAGIRSAEKSACMFIENGFDVKIVKLPAGCDPCDYIVSNGKDAFLKQIENGDDFFDFKLKIAKAAGVLESVSGKAKVFNDIILTAMKIPDILRQRIQINEIAGKLNIGEADIAEHLKNIGVVPKRRVTETVNPVQIRSKSRPDLGKFSASHNVETSLIMLMVADNRFIPMVRDEIGLENFFNDELKHIARTIFDEYSAHCNVTDSGLFSALAEPALHTVLADIMSIDSIFGDNDQIFKGCLHYFKRKKSRNVIKKTKELTKGFKSDSDKTLENDGSANLNELLDKFHKENRKLQSFKGGRDGLSGLTKRSKIFM